MHFTNYQNGRDARNRFDLLKPTSLLYKKTSDGYTLIGAMYTDRVDAGEDELNQRIPLSVARWHQHVNFCKAPPGQMAGYFGADAKFGLMGSISTKNVWSIDDHDSSHDNMNHTAMPGMKMD